MKSFKYFLLTLLSTFILFNTKVEASEEVVVERISGSEVDEGGILRVKDDKYDFMAENENWETKFSNEEVENLIIFSVDPYSDIYQPGAYSVDVELKVSYEEWVDGVGFVNQTISPNPVLTVNYSLAGSYKDKHIYKFENGHNVNVSIEKVTPSVAGAIMNLALESEIRIKRNYDFQYYNSPSVNRKELSSRGELEVSWSHLEGAEEYELEWTYVNYFDINTNIKNAEDILLETRTFDFNSTRINTSYNFYKIPLVYEPGYIIYRVRGIGYKEDAYGRKKLLPGKWSTLLTENSSVADLLATNSAFEFDGHEENLNWQYTINYAEGGKRKVAVSYFDGSLRARQAVSHLNTEDETIAGETIYDHQGREAIQIIPVPTGVKKIRYVPFLNVDTAGIPYSRENFDLDGDTTCITPPSPLDSVSGSSLYYSSSNPDKKGYQGYVPSAGGYPFTQKEYTPDNTGRIKAESGIGDSHYIGSDHETRTYYGKPLQEELDRLFGSEAGYAKHYKKNMSRDANGQISVTYSDAKGNTIATALAGAAPSNLDSLEGGLFFPMDVDLLGKTDSEDLIGSEEEIELAEGTRSFSQEILVTSEGPREFEYELRNQKYIKGCKTELTSENFCYECVVELKIILTDDCGNNFLLLDEVNDTSVVIVGENILADIRNSSYTRPGLSDSPSSFKKDKWYTTLKEDGRLDTVSLKPGNYTITKILKVNEEALEHYVNDYVSSDTTCLRTIQDFRKNALQQVDSLGCGMPCDSCFSRLGDYEQYDIDVNPDCAPCLTEAEYNKKAAECQAICDDGAVNCRSAYENMIMDMNPFGQYGGIYDDEGNFTPESFPLSVYNENNYLGTEKNWRNPQLENNQGKIYLDHLGNRALVEVVDVSGSENYIPEPTSNDFLIFKEGKAYVEPQNLKYVEDYIMFWEDSWAKSLVIYHPEYAYYEFCLSNQDSHEFDNQWLSSDTFENPDINTVNPLGSGTANSLDPYFYKVNPDISFIIKYRRMKWRMHNYMVLEGRSYSIWEIAYAMVKCPYFNNNPEIGSCAEVPFCLDNLPEGFGVDHSVTASVFGENEEVFKKFKNLYHSLKQDGFYNKEAVRYAINHESYNGCFDVGDEGFDFRANNFYRTRRTDNSNSFFGWSFWFDSQYFNWKQPCNWYTKQFYKDKRPRFPQMDNMMDIESDDSGLCYEEADIDGDGITDEYIEVQCPDENIQVIKELENKAEYKLYQACGECPISKDLETLLDAVVRHEGVSLTDDFQLSCYPEGLFAEFVPDLEVALGLSGQGEVYWKVQNQMDNQLEIQFERAGSGNTDICPLTLYLAPTYTVTDYSTGQDVEASFNWSDILSLCCISSRASISYPSDPSRDFTMNAVVEYRQADGSTRNVKIEIEGTSCINLTDCPIPVICEETEYRNDLLNLLNTLTFEIPASGSSSGIPYTFITDASGVILDTNVSESLENARFKAVVTDNLYSLFPAKPSLLKWTADPATSTYDTLLTATLSGNGLNGNGYNFQLSYKPEDMPVINPWEKIVGFRNLRMNGDDYDLMYSNGERTDHCNYFKIVAQIEYMVGSETKTEFVPMEGYTCIPIGNCNRPDVDTQF